MPDRRTVAWILGPLAALVAVLALFQGVALASRRSLPEQRVHEVKTAAEGYAALSADGVRGRVLVLLDERSRVLPRVWMADFLDRPSGDATPPVMLHNSTSFLVYSGMVRAVYLVPPGSYYWQRELERFTARPDALPDGDGARVRFNGVPVYLRTPADLPSFREKVVVWVFEPALEGYSKEFVRYITDPTVADVVVKVAGE